MGYYTDGVTYFWWDDNQNLGGADPHVPGTPHTLAEYAIAFPGVCDEMQNPAGGKTKAGLCYLISQNTVIGGKAGVDAFNQTTWTETLSKYVFLAPGKTLTIRAQGAVPNVTLNHGTKIGSGSRITGSRGVNWYQAASLALQQNCNLYGGKYESDAGIQMLDSAINNTIEVAGCEFQGTTGVLGFQASGLSIYNSLVGLSSNVTSLGMKASDNLVVGSTGNPSYLVNSAGSPRKPKGLVLIGNPTTAVARVANSWVLVRTKWPIASVPHIEAASFTLDPNGISGVREMEEYHFRVMDRFGEPIASIPATIVTSGADYISGYDPWFSSGLLFPKYTNIEGDYVWTDVITGDPNNLVARSWGRSSGTIIWKDRSFTISVNLKQHPGFLPQYPSRVLTYTAPGRDMRNGLPEALGGDFYTTITIPIVMSEGGVPGEWEKCEI